METHRFPGTRVSGRLVGESREGAQAVGRLPLRDQSLEGIGIACMCQAVKMLAHVARPDQLNNNCKSSIVRLRMTLLSAETMASASSRLCCCRARIFSSTVSLQISR
jgi:hypothetical protein